MTFRGRVVSFALLALVALSGTAAARTIYVNSAFTGTYQDGSQATPFRLLDNAFKVAVNGTSWETGDVIELAPGSYHSGYYSSYYGGYPLKNFLTIRGTDATKTIFADPMIVAPVSAANVRFSKVGFYDDCHTSFTINRIGYPKGTWIFEDCIFNEIRRAIDANGNIDVLMTRCVFYGGDYEYSIMSQHGTGTATLVNCVFLRPRYYVARINNKTSHALDIVNSIFSIPANAYVYYPPTAVVAWTYSYPYSFDIGSLASVRYSDLYRFGLQASVVREGLISANPLFQNDNVSYYPYRTPDLRLRPESPCIDTGISVGLPFSGTAPDMGAYEFGVAPPPPDPTPQPTPDPTADPTPDPTLVHTLDEIEAAYVALITTDLEMPVDNRRNAFLHKFDAVTRKYEEIKDGTLAGRELRAAYADLRDKLTGDLIPKCNDHVTSAKVPDWIVDSAERDEIYKLLKQAVALLDKEIAALK